MVGRLRRLAASRTVGRSPIWASSRADFTPTDGRVLRAERVVRNQIFFREVNEEIGAAARRLSRAPELADVHFHFLCECAKRGCVDPISLSAEEYEALRQDPLMFVVAPGHQIASIEQLVAQNERFACVRKFHPEPSKSAREHDPRKEAEIGERPPADACA